MSLGKKYTPEQIVYKLREAKVAISEGQTAALAAKSIGVMYQTYCRWVKEYGGLRADQAKRLKESMPDGNFSSAEKGAFA